MYTPVNGEVERYASAVLDFDEGRFGLIDCSFEFPLRQVAEIIGEEGTITIPSPFSLGHIEAVVILAVEGQTIHDVPVVRQGPYRPVWGRRVPDDHLSAPAPGGQPPAVG